MAVILTAAALYLSFRRLAWSDFLAAFGQANFFWVLAAALVSLFAVQVLGWRWQLLLRPKEAVPLAILFRLNIINQFVNIVLPARLGELARAYLTSKESTISGSYALGTVVVEKLFDLATFVALWVIVPPLFSLGDNVRTYAWALVVLILALGLAILAASRPQLFWRWTEKALPFLPESWRAKIRRLAVEGSEPFGLLRQRRLFFSLAGLSLAVLVGELLPITFLFYAFKIAVPPWSSLFVLLLLVAGRFPPSLPGRIGIYEYAVILALAPFGVNRAVALSYAIMLHLVTCLPRIILGAIFTTGIKGEVTRLAGT